MSWTVVARGVSYEFANGRELFTNLNFALDAKLSALVGPNGVGKTCLARLIAGDFEPTEGVVRRIAPVKLFPQRREPNCVTVTEFLSVEYEWSLLGESLLRSIDRQAVCTTLSGGQWMRVRLACALNNEFLVLDEPTNDLDREGRRALIQFLQRHRRGALLISHDRECLEICEETFELSNRGLAKFGGGWLAYMGAREEERERLNSALNLAKRERDSTLADRAHKIIRQEKRNRRGTKASARGGTPKVLLGARKRRAQSTSGRIDALTLERSENAVREAHAAIDEIKVDPVMYADLVSREIPAQKLVAEAHGFNVRLRDWVFRDDLNFAWRGNVRIAVRGANGSGKSTLLKAMLGDVFETRGQLRPGNLVTLYLDQRCGFLDDRKSVFDNVRVVSSASESEIRSDLAKLLFSKEAVFQKVGELSGGERLRAALARGLLSTKKPEVIMLDEPTNNLDLTNIRFLGQIMRAFRGAMVVVSHDERFLEDCGISEELVLQI